MENVARRYTMYYYISTHTHMYTLYAHSPPETCEHAYQTTPLTVLPIAPNTITHFDRVIHLWYTAYALNHHQKSSSIFVHFLSSLVQSVIGVELRILLALILRHVWVVITSPWYNTYVGTSHLLRKDLTFFIYSLTHDYVS